MRSRNGSNNTLEFCVFTLQHVPFRSIPERKMAAGHKRTPSRTACESSSIGYFFSSNTVAFLLSASAA
jgi:hypothetical protein